MESTGTPHNNEGDATLVARIMEESIGTEPGGHHKAKYDPSTGRAVALTLGTDFSLSPSYDRHWDLSPTIGLLQDLESLSLNSCKALPSELGNLKKLKSLTLTACRRLEEFPANLFPSTNDQSDRETTATDNGIWQLEEFRILGIVPMIPHYILTQIAQLRHLRVLQFSFHSLSTEEECPNLRQFLLPEIQFKDSLQELILNRCHITDEGFDTLMNHVLHRYPNVKRLSLCNNQITSLECLVSPGPKTETSSSQARFVNLEELVLSENPVWRGRLSIRGSVEMEQRYLTEFLECFAISLSYLGYRFRHHSVLWSRTIEQWLGLNKAGRFLVDQGRSRKDISSIKKATDDKAVVPLSLWPVILARVNHLAISERTFPKGVNDDECLPEEKSANAIFYLLRHGPATAGEFGRGW
jgi:hypothetical protein